MPKRARSSATTPSTPPPSQVTLPRQAHTAEGPHDQTGMYVMHHALRRDFVHFVGAVQHTPVSEHAVWRALAARWARLAEALHHHHSAEDHALWPLLRQHAEQTGSPEDLRLLADMAAEHAQIDPALASCREAFAAMSEHPCEDHRTTLASRLAAAHTSLLEHLAHEETHALPLLQRTLTEAENAAFEKAVERSYPLRMVPFLLPWAMDGVPDEVRDRMLATTPPGYGLLLRALRRRFDRGERAAFRYA